MGTIRISVDPSSAYSIFEIEGQVTADDIISAMDSHYTAEAPPHALWDYSGATFHDLDTADYTQIALAAKRLAPGRKGGRTAFVAPGALEAVAVKLLEAVSKAIDLPIPLRICATRVEAATWLTANG